MQACVVNNFERGIEMGFIPDKILTKEFVSRIYFLGITGIKDEKFIFQQKVFTKTEIMDNFSRVTT